MKKVLLLTLSALLAFNMFAAGKGDGSSKEDAIEFDWVNGNTQEGGQSLWYSVSLTPIYEEENPALALYLTNLSMETSNVEIEAFIAGNNEKRQYTLEGHQNKVWSQSASLLVRMKYTEILVKLTTEKQSHLSAKVYEFEDVDEACLTADDFNWTTGATVAPYYRTWFKVNLEDAKAAGKDVKVTITNTGTAETTVYAGISVDCPSTGLTEKSTKVAAGETITKTLSKSMVASLKDNFVYAVIDAGQPVKVTAELVEPATPTYDQTACESATPVALDVTYNIAAGEAWYQIPVKKLMGKRMQPQVTIQNEGGATATIKGEVIFECGEAAAMSKTIKLAANGVVTKDVAKNMIDGIDTAKYDVVYLHVVTNQPLTCSARLKNVHEGDACKTAQAFNYDVTTYQNADIAVWYAVSIKEAKENVQDIKITLDNRSSEVAHISADIAFECPYTDLQSFSKNLNAKEKLTKTIKYSSFSMFGDTIYVCVETNQPISIEATMVPSEKKSTDEACLNAIEFDWKNGHVQNAGDAVWYKVAMADVRGNNDIPEVTIVNRGTSTLKINAELSTICPDTLENQKRSLFIKAGSIYTKEISRDLFKNIEADTVYIKLTADQEFSFMVKMLKEEEGKSCLSAIPFNWVSGNDQAANTTVWYYADMRDVKANEKDVKAILINRENVMATIAADFAATCPCETPQSQSVKLAANAEKSKLLVNSTFDSYNDTVYFRIKTDAAIHFEAQLQEPEEFELNICDSTKVEVLPDVEYTQDKDTVWYMAIVENYKDEVLVPKITFMNGATAQTIYAALSYTCEMTKTPQMESRKLGANGVASKVVERSLIPEKDTAFIRLVGKNFKFKVEMVNPNDGSDCRHALDLALDTTYNQEASTMWYRFNTNIENIEQLKFIPKMWNTDAAAKVTVSLYEDCEGELIQEATTTVSALREKEVMGDVVANFSKTGAILAKIVCDQPIALRVDTTMRAKIDSIYECADAKPLMMNVDYYQAADAAMWYEINVKDIRENTEGDAELFIENFGGGQAKLKAEIAYDCPVAYEMTTKQQTVTGEFTKELERAKFDAVTKDIVYVRITSTDTIHFIVRIDRFKGETCGDPIAFDWENCNVNPKNEPTWYVAKMINADSTLVIPEGKDLQISVTNLTDSSATAEAAFYFECGEQAIARPTYTFDPRQTVNRTIDRDLIVEMHPTALFIMMSGSQPMKICADFVEPLSDSTIVVKHDTIICAGDYNPFYNTTLTVYLDKDSVLRDTVSFQSGLRMVDSVYVDSVIIFRDVLVQEIPASAIPQAIAGQAFDTLALFTNVKAIYDAATSKDTIANVERIEWKVLDLESQPVKYVAVDEMTYWNSLPADIDSLRFQYIVHGCNHPMVTDYLQVEIKTQIKAKDTLTYCKQSQIDTIWHDQHITEPGSYTYKDDSGEYWLKVELNDVPDTLGMDIVSKFGYRMLVFNLNKFKADNEDLTPAENTVEWYSTADPVHPIHAGYYYTLADGGVITGSYYAVIKVVNPDACDQTFISNTLVNNSGVSMRLAPNCVSEGGLMTIYNVDPTQATSVRIIDATGREVGYKKSNDMENVNVEATWPVGAYLMRVENASQNDTFRFLIVR
ncbi:MAG: T9SS type A sorting domain-containing protein [Bacteroidales bacterium]|nr:T9SS type A sorting domain-containing protein [Candidatus Colicola equi]